MDTRKKKLDFVKPPVEEVVLSILFQSLDRLLAPHLGEIWQEFKKDGFTRVMEQPPVMPTMETFPNPSQGAQFHINVPDLPRIWFIHENDSQILQVQRDRFTFNWRKTKSGQKYPGFSAIFDSFEGFYNRFYQTIKNMDIGLLTPVQYELTYIDQLPQGVGWNTLDDIGKIYNPFVDSQHLDSFWSCADFVNLRVSFPVPNLHGRLHLAVGNRVKHLEQQTLQTDFTARGLPENTESEMSMWFKSAHDQILEKFTSIFTEDIQTRVWERKP